MTDAGLEAWQGLANEDGPILVALDFAPDSEAALLWACRQAKLVGASLVLLHVVHDPADAPGYYRIEAGDPMRPMDDIAAQMMNERLEEIAIDCPDLDVLQGAERVLVEGLPESRIPEIAAAKGARLIVMGSRGRSGLPHLLLGSKAQHVVRVAPMPVTVVKARAGRKND